MDEYRYRGARSMVALHERHLREFLAAWRRADARGIELPATADPSYASRETLLAHVLGAPAHYLSWIAEKLELPAPDLEERVGPPAIAADPDGHLASVLSAWRGPILRSLTEEQAEVAHPSRWGPPYCIDAMLEHAVMHPIRHAFQLEELMKG